MNNADREITEPDFLSNLIGEIEQVEDYHCESILDSLEHLIEARLDKLASTPPTESVEGRIQPSDIGDILHTKYAHRKHNDEHGFTGHFNLSPREVLDVMIDLKATHPTPESEEHPIIKGMREMADDMDKGLEDMLKKYIAQARKEEQVSMINRFESCMIDMDTENGTLIVDLDKYGPEFDEIKSQLGGSDG